MVLIPLSDDAPHSDERPVVTQSLIAITVLVFLWRLTIAGGDDLRFDLNWGVVPRIALGEFGGGPLVRFLPFLTYMFLHNGWAHLLGNMLFLWIFGDDVEHATGRARFLALYLISGVAGAALHVAFAPQAGAPLIGASGAIAGVMGAYLMIRPCANIKMLIFVAIVRVRAMWVIAAWALLQLWQAFAHAQEEVAWWAHIGGLIAGVALIAVLKRKDVRLLECVQRETFVNPWTIVGKR